MICSLLRARADARNPLAQSRRDSAPLLEGVSVGIRNSSWEMAGDGADDRDGGGIFLEGRNSVGRRNSDPSASSFFGRSGGLGGLFEPPNGMFQTSLKTLNCMISVVATT